MIDSDKIPQEWVEEKKRIWSIPDFNNPDNFSFPTGKWEGKTVIEFSPEERKDFYDQNILYVKVEA